MASLAELQADLAAIKKARNSGVLIVQKGDNRTQFRSLAEMDRIIASLEGEVAGLSDGAPRVRTIRMNTRDVT